LDALIVSTAVVAIAEIGDKTQLLALMLAARYGRPLPITAGILLATLANHALAALVGLSVASLLDPALLRWLLGLSFLAMAGWALVPDRPEDADGRLRRLGAFAATLISFFLVEMGDKTQIATVALAARYHTAAWVTAGTTLGMLIANLPVVLMGGLAAKRLPVRALRLVAALLFAGLGVATLAGPWLAGLAG
jgi:putative Ca2+/H+ antiporter (TMEM165/GDT1 family)